MCKLNKWNWNKRKHADFTPYWFDRIHFRIWKITTRRHLCNKSVLVLKTLIWNVSRVQRKHARICCFFFISFFSHSFDVFFFLSWTLNFILHLVVIDDAVIINCMFGSYFSFYKAHAIVTNAQVRYKNKKESLDFLPSLNISNWKLKKKRKKKSGTNDQFESTRNPYKYK